MTGGKPQAETVVRLRAPITNTTRMLVGEAAMTDTDYVVIRAAADLPTGFLPGDLDGKWFDRSVLPMQLSRGDMPNTVGVAHPTGRFEVRDDGAVAEVFEVRSDWGKVNDDDTAD